MNAVSRVTGAAPLIRTVEFLCDRGDFGYAALDVDYRSLWRHGVLASWIPLDVNICQQTDIFFGLEKELLDLQDEDGRCITLPRIGISEVGDPADKMSVEIYWDEKAAIYHVVIHRLVAESEVELELLKQIRARRLAEENFQTTRETLAHKNMLLDIIMEHLPVSVAVFDADKRFLFVTCNWARQFRIECEPLLGQRLIEACPAIPDGPRQLFEKTLAGLTTDSHIDMLDDSEPGVPGYRWTHKVWSHPVDDTGGILTTVEDVNRLAHQNYDLKLANQQLRAANRQLGHFASIIAHDLSGPLRSLKATLEGESESRTRTEKDVRSSVLAHIDRMQNILAGSNEYMRVLCFEPVVTAVDVGQLVREIMKTLPGGESFRATLSLEVSVITANPGILDLVLRNLIENAIKHHDREDGHLRITLEDKGETWFISIADDGPGIAMCKQQTLLEGCFQKVGVRMNIENGKGLPIVIHALSGIGGMLQIESDPTKIRGARFLISWPKEVVPAAKTI